MGGLELGVGTGFDFGIGRLDGFIGSDSLVIYVLAIGTVPAGNRDF